MSNTQYAEALSADPYVRDLHRKAVRLLNDPSLDRQQREEHIRRLQSRLVEHLASVALKAQKLAEKMAARDQMARTHGNSTVADPSQVVARRKEFSQARQECAAPAVKVAEAPVTGVAHGASTTGARRILTLSRG